MFSVALVLICFFAQFAFLIGEEFLLAVLIVILVLLLVSLVLELFVHQAQTKQINLIKSIAKRQILASLILSQLVSQLDKINDLTNSSAELVADLFFCIPDELANLFNEKLEFSLTNYFIDLLDPIADADSLALLELKEAFFSEFSDELSVDLVELIDDTFEEFIDDTFEEFIDDTFDDDNLNVIS